LKRLAVRQLPAVRRLTTYRVGWAAALCIVMLAAFVPAASANKASKTTKAGNNNPLNLITPGVLRVAVTGASKPYVYLNASGNTWIGFEPDLVHYVAKAAGIKKVVFVEQEFSSLLAAVANRRYDIGAACIGRTAERLKTVNYVTDYNNGYLIFIGKSGAGIASTSDLSGKRVGTITGSVEELYLQTKVPAASIVEFPDDNSAVQALLSGSVDTVFLDTGTADQYVKQYPQLAELIKVQSTAPCAWPISKQDTALTKALDRGMVKAICAGYVASLTRKWLPGTPLFPQYTSKRSGCKKH
jgi:polar amino acid transport system substrate-binding protein